jgi:hypothetical protein
MHALGVAGMARRIPDYSDGFLNWTRVMTIGTFATLISLPLPAKALLTLLTMPHPFHLVDYSPWPLFASIALFSFALSIISFMTFASYFAFIGIFPLILIAILWWRDLIREGIGGFHTLEAVLCC